jgi:hypothetical protein
MFQFESRPHKKRNTSSKRELRTPYPLNCNLSANHEKRPKFNPCDHEGRCGHDCPCVASRVHCEKQCGCPLVPTSLSQLTESRTVLGDGGVVLVNLGNIVGLGGVNVMNGRENVILIFATHVMQLKFSILLILRRPKMRRFVRVVVGMLLFSVVS